MTAFRFEALLPTEARRWYIERQCPALLGLQAEMLNLQRLEIVDAWEASGAAFVKQVQQPDPKAWLPRGTRGQLQGELVFVNVIEARPELVREPPYELRVRGEVPMFGDKAEICYRVLIEEAGVKQTREVVEGEVRIHVFALGGLGERLLKRSMQQTYEQLPEIVSRWEAFRAELLRQPHGAQRLLAGRPEALNNAEWVSREVRAMLRAPSKRGRSLPGDHRTSFNVATSPGGESGETAGQVQQPAAPAELHAALTQEFPATQSELRAAALPPNEGRRSDGGQLQPSAASSKAELEQAPQPHTPRTEEKPVRAPSGPPASAFAAAAGQAVSAAEVPWIEFWRQMGVPSTSDDECSRKLVRLATVGRQFGLVRPQAVTAERVQPTGGPVGGARTPPRAPDWLRRLCMCA